MTKFNVHYTVIGNGKNECKTVEAETPKEVGEIAKELCLQPIRILKIKVVKG